MNSSKLSRGVPLPSFWQCVIISAALPVGWLLWQEFENPVESLHAVEVFAARGRDAVPRLVAELSASDPGARAFAVHGLGKIGPTAADALDQIRERLTDDSPQVRANAIIALRSISEDSDEAGRVAAQMLADPNADVRDAAATQLLFRIGPVAMKNVLEMLQNDRAAARSRALRVLRQWKPPRSEGLPEWLTEVRGPVRRLLDDPNSGVRIDALTALVAWGIAEPDEIRELLHNEDAARVEVALGAIPELRERAAALLPDVVVLIDRFQLDSIPAPGNQTDPRPMRLILDALKTMETAARPAAPRLIRLLEARRDLTRTPITETLVAVGTETDDLVRVLTPLLLDKDQNVAFHAGQLLVEVSPEAARGQVSKILPQLGSGASVNRSVLWALSALGPQAREAAPQVAPLVENPDPGVSFVAKQVLNNIGPDPEPTIPAGR